MSFVMPGQKIDASAFAVMAEVPWWEACRAERHMGRSEGGMVLVEDDAITAIQVSPELVVFSDWRGKLVLELWESVFDGREKEEHVLV